MYANKLISSFRRSRLLVALGLICLVIVAGTFGYRFIEGWPILDALYMTVITMTTIGYGEVRELSQTGRIFTLGLIVASIVIAGYSLSQLTAFVFEGEFNRLIQGHRMDRRIRRMKDHVILCGCGSTGIHIAVELARSGIPFLIIEADTSRMGHVLDVVGDVPFLEDDATKDETLKRAGIENARGLIASTSNDKDNVFIVLTARSMNSDLRIVSRLIEDENYDKLRRAGADEIISPNAMGGLRMASVMVRPTAVSLMDELLSVPDHTLGIEEIHVEEIPELVGKTLGEANIGKLTRGLLVVAIIEIDRGYTFNPGAQTRLQPGDKLIVMGNAEQREAIHSLG